MKRILLAVALLLGFTQSSVQAAPSFTVPDGWTVSSIYSYWDGYTHTFYAFVNDLNGNTYLAFFEQIANYPSHPYSMGVPTSDYSIANHPNTNYSQMFNHPNPDVFDAYDVIYGPTSPPESTATFKAMPEPYVTDGNGVSQVIGGVTYYYQYGRDSAGNYLTYFYSDNTYSKCYAICAVQYND